MSKLLYLLTLTACASSAHVDPAPAPQPAAEHSPAEHHGGGMHHRFDNADQWAKVFDDPARDAWQRPDLVLAALELRPGMAVADIGAGTGYFAVRLARAVPGGQVIATDIEPDMIRFMTERAAREQLPNLRAVLTPPDDPKLAPSRLDRILVVDVWHHLDDRPAYARALARALRPGGKLAIVDFTLESKHGPPAKHRLAPDEILADLRAAGLTASISPTTLPDQYIAIGTR
jgi:cyclopropane fatty-acyl-phospholipid synthase-like methyltransferase